MANKYVVDLFLKKKFAVVDIQKRTIGIYNSDELVEFFGVSFVSLLPYIRGDKRYGLLYRIYTEDTHKKMIANGLLQSELHIPRSSGNRFKENICPDAPKPRAQAPQKPVPRL